ncbi:hypothetical protein EDB85DRAFT_246990 [Lactarius pseudohatsudake]|nr:hypothetical protein EDB85DRAFT_246990 [Lactarius pseudohatsudake]
MEALADAFNVLRKGHVIADSRQLISMPTSLARNSTTSWSTPLSTRPCPLGVDNYKVEIVGGSSPPLLEEAGHYPSHREECTADSRSILRVRGLVDRETDPNCRGQAPIAGAGSNHEAEDARVFMEAGGWAQRNCECADIWPRRPAFGVARGRRRRCCATPTVIRECFEMMFSNDVVRFCQCYRGAGTPHSFFIRVFMSAPVTRILSCVALLPRNIQSTIQTIATAHHVTVVLISFFRIY